MSVWNEMTYDEQRAFLGLPDVRDYVVRQALLREWDKIKTMGQLVGQALGISRGIDIGDPRDYGLTRGDK